MSKVMTMRDLCKKEQLNINKLAHEVEQLRKKVEKGKLIENKAADQILQLNKIARAYRIKMLEYKKQLEKIQKVEKTTLIIPEFQEVKVGGSAVDWASINTMCDDINTKALEELGLQ